MQNEPQTIPQDTIDLRELFDVLKRRKKMIGIVTIAITLLAFVYAFFIAKPVYSGSTIVELGKVINKKYIDGSPAGVQIVNIDNPNDLKLLVSKETGVNVSIPKGTKILQLSYLSTNKDEIRKKLQSAIHYVMERHKKLKDIFAGSGTQIKMTQQIGKISVGMTPVKPRKKLIVIVAFITGLMLSVFLAFFLEFLSGMKEEEK